MFRRAALFPQISKLLFAVLLFSIFLIPRAAAQMGGEQVRGDQGLKSGSPHSLMVNLYSWRCPTTGRGSAWKLCVQGTASTIFNAGWRRCLGPPPSWKSQPMQAPLSRFAFLEL